MNRNKPDRYILIHPDRTLTVSFRFPKLILFLFFRYLNSPGCDALHYYKIRRDISCPGETLFDHNITFLLSMYCSTADKSRRNVRCCRILLEFYYNQPLLSLRRFARRIRIAIAITSNAMIAMIMNRKVLLVSPVVGVVVTTSKVVWQDPSVYRN